MKHALLQHATWALVGWFVGMIAVSITASFYVSWIAALILFFLAALFILFVVQPVWGVYALAAAAPLSGLTIAFSHEQSLARIPYIGSIEAPLVDFLAIIILCAAPLVLLLNPKKIFVSHVRVMCAWFVVWFIAVGLAVYYGDQVFFGISAKAALRPYLFSYLAFVIPVLLFVRGRAEIVGAAVAYEVVCVAGALMGAISLFVTDSIGFPRVQPFAMFGVAPFGTNHNVLAEALTAIIPFAVWWAAAQKSRAEKIWWGGAAALIVAVAVLTFSRAAWIVVALQGLFFLFLFGKKSVRRGAAIFLVCAVLAGFFFWIEHTKVADSSNATRLDLTGIALLYFSRAPLTGQGPGTFVPLVGETTAFRMDYGEPLDAHGFLQKMLAETGMLGTVAFVALLGVLGVRLWKHRYTAWGAMWFVTVISLWTYQLFNTGYFVGKVWVLMGLALATLI